MSPSRGLNGLCASWFSGAGGRWHGALGGGLRGCRDRSPSCAHRLGPHERGAGASWFFLLMRSPVRVRACDRLVRPGRVVEQRPLHPYRFLLFLEVADQTDNPWVLYVHPRFQGGGGDVAAPGVVVVDDDAEVVDLEGEIVAEVGSPPPARGAPSRPVPLRRRRRSPRAGGVAWSARRSSTCRC